MESVEYLGFLIEVVSPETGTYEYSVFDMTGNDKPEFSLFETDDVEFVSYEAAVNDAKGWIRDFLFYDGDRAMEHIEKLYATKKALSGLPSVETTGRLLPKLTVDVFNRPDCPKWAKFAVVNANGGVVLFSDEPSCRDGRWAVTRYSTSTQATILDDDVRFDASDWKNSLIERPAKLPDWCKVDAVGWHKRCGYFKVTYIDDVSKHVDIQQETDRSKGYLSFHTVCNETIQARLRPYNAKEMRGLVGKVIDDPDSSRLVTAYAESDRAKILTSRGWYTADDLMISDYTVDGSHCGKLEHLENGEWVE